jgi:NAD(P)-dependent dehydrogenase (short-subunit alcohol dehydrogenase family)
MTRLEGKITVVTGSAVGIGRGIAEAFASEGAAVVAVDIDAEGVEETASKLKAEGGDALALVADVSVEAEVEEVAQKALAERLPGDLPYERDAWRANDEEIVALMSTEDAIEGPTAFAEKREPVWKAK